MEHYNSVVVDMETDEAQIRLSSFTAAIKPIIEQYNPAVLGVQTDQVAYQKQLSIS